MANIADGSYLEDFSAETPKMVAGKVETTIQVEIKATFEDSFIGKDGNVIPFFAAMVPVRHGLKQVSITKALYEQVTKPSIYTVKMAVDLNYGKTKFDIC